MKEICVFCGEKKETETTTIVGGYCIDCHRINIEQSRDAIRKIQNRKKKYNQCIQGTLRR